MVSFSATALFTISVWLAPFAFAMPASFRFISSGILKLTTAMASTFRANLIVILAICFVYTKRVTRFRRGKYDQNSNIFSTGLSAIVRALVCAVVTGGAGFIGSL